RKGQWKGGIYRVRHADAPAVRDPWGTQVDWQRANVKQLRELLKDARPVVRERAQRQLSARGGEAIAELTALLKEPRLVRSRLHAVWALADINDDEALRPLNRLVIDWDESVELRAAAARALGLRRAKTYEASLARLLGENDAGLRLAAAEALARCGTP